MKNMIYFLLMLIAAIAGFTSCTEPQLDKVQVGDSKIVRVYDEVHTRADYEAVLNMLHDGEYVVQKQADWVLTHEPIFSGPEKIEPITQEKSILVVLPSGKIVLLEVWALHDWEPPVLFDVDQYKPNEDSRYINDIFATFTGTEVEYAAVTSRSYDWKDTHIVADFLRKSEVQLPN